METSIYDTFDKNLYRIGSGNNTSAVDSLIAEPTQRLNVAQSAIESGGSTDIKDMYVGAIAGGKTSFDNTDPGYILGIEKGVPKFFLGNSTNYINFDGSTTTIVGGLSVDFLDIPDTTTANSFHVDVNGNTWWGANTATGYTGANAYILSTGAAVFKNIVIGGTTIQYVITNSGIFSYGDGSDGTATCDGSTAVTGMSRSGSIYTLTRDVYFDSLTINSGVTVKPDGYRIFVKNTFTVSGTIERNGGNGTNGSNGITSPFGPAGGAGASQTDGYLIGGASGGAGGAAGAAGGAGVDGTAGESASNCLGVSGSAGGSGGGGSGATPPPGAGGAAGTATAANVKLIANWHLATLLDISSSGSTVKFTPNGGGGGGGGGSGGAGGSGVTGGSGGGGGCAGGIIAIYAKVLTISATGSITANGGNGGNGGSGFSASQGAGGGGSGGNGGIIVLVYNSYTNNGSITVNGGTKGTAGATSLAPAAQDGSNGSTGTIYQFQLSL